MVFDEDLAFQFSSTDPFCVLGTFSNAVTAYGRFIDATESVALIGNQLEANDPTFECRTSEVETVTNEMTVVINSVTYTVKRRQRIGTGVTLFYLKT